MYVKSFTVKQIDWERFPNWFLFAIVVSSCLKLIYQIKALQIVLDEKAIY